MIRPAWAVLIPHSAKRVAAHATLLPARECAFNKQQRAACDCRVHYVTMDPL
jgi:hypothetical protein